VVTYGYDSLNRVNSILNGGATLVSGVSYNDWGQQERITYGSGAYDDWSTKDGGVHLDKWTMGYVQGGAYADYTSNPRIYQYDTAERLTQAAEWALTLDSKGRLVNASANDLSLVGGTFVHDGFDYNTSSTYGGAASVAMNL